MSTIDTDTSWLAEQPEQAQGAVFDPADYAPGGTMWWGFRAKCTETDAGNAERFRMDHSEDVRAVVGDRWIAFDGTRWAFDDADDGEATRRALTTVKHIAHELDRAPLVFEDDKAKNRRYAFHLQCQKPSRVTDLLRFARVDERLRVTADQLDAHPDLLNCASGVIDLRTGELHPHDRAGLHTKLSPVGYEPHTDEAAGAPVWHGFLDTIFAGDRDLIAYVQRALGYIATGHTSEQTFFIAHGAGANGKSVMARVVSHVLGDYATSAAAETFMLSRRGGGDTRSDLVRLRGARLVTTSETSDGLRFDDRLLKELTGGEAITARALYAAETTFTPRLKLWISCNALPRFDGADYAMRRRLRVIPFEVQIPAAEQDPGLPGRLMAEAPGILAWIVAGARAWHEHGLGTAAAIETASAISADTMDPVGQYLEDETTADPSGYLASTVLLERYTAWAERHGQPKMTGKRLGDSLARHGLTSGREYVDGKRCRVWIGARFTPSGTREDGSSRKSLRRDELGSPGTTSPGPSHDREMGSES